MSAELSLDNGNVSQEPVSGWRWAFRILRWSTYLAALITVVMVMHKSPAPNVTTTPQAAASAERKIEQVEQSVSRGERPILRLDESELNSYLATHLALAPQADASPPPTVNPGDGGGPGAPSARDVEEIRSSVRDVKVQMENDQVKAYVVFDVHGKDMTLQLAGRLGAADGYLRFDPESGQIGSLPIPKSTLQTAVERLMQSPENRERLKLPGEIEDVRIENGELVATYR